MTFKQINASVLHFIIVIIIVIIIIGDPSKSSGWYLLGVLRLL